MTYFSKQNTNIDGNCSIQPCKPKLYFSRIAKYSSIVPVRYRRQLRNPLGTLSRLSLVSFLGIDYVLYVDKADSKPLAVAEIKNCSPSCPVNNNYVARELYIGRAVEESSVPTELRLFRYRALGKHPQHQIAITSAHDTILRTLHPKYRENSLNLKLGAFFEYGSTTFGTLRNRRFSLQLLSIIKFYIYFVVFISPWEQCVITPWSLPTAH